jgi:hypothetical protein
VFPIRVLEVCAYRSAAPLILVEGLVRVTSSFFFCSTGNGITRNRNQEIIAGNPIIRPSFLHGNACQQQERSWYRVQQMLSVQCMSPRRRVSSKIYMTLMPYLKRVYDCGSIHIHAIHKSNHQSYDLLAAHLFTACFHCYPSLFL